MLCERCNKRDTVTTIGGRKLCSVCAKDEIVKRIKREFYPRKALVENDKIIIAYPVYLKPLSELLINIITKLYKKFNIEYLSLEIEPINNINDEIWKLILKSKCVAEKSGIKKIILPYTSDFLMAYLIYATAKGDYTYVNLMNFEYKVNDILYLLPFYNTSLMELNGFENMNEYRIVTMDEVFNDILEWEKSLLKDNYELFHAFQNSRKIFEEKSYRCEECGGIINSPVKRCERCSLISASLPC